MNTLVRDEGVASSNLATPTKLSRDFSRGQTAPLRSKAAAAALEAPAISHILRKKPWEI